VRGHPPRNWFIRMGLSAEKLLIRQAESQGRAPGRAGPAGPRCLATLVAPPDATSCASRPRLRRALPVVVVSAGAALSSGSASGRRPEAAGRGAVRPSPLLSTCGAARWVRGTAAAPAPSAALLPPPAAGRCPSPRSRLSAAALRPAPPWGGSGTRSLRDPRPFLRGGGSGGRAGLPRQQGFSPGACPRGGQAVGGCCPRLRAAARPWARRRLPCLPPRPGRGRSLLKRRRTAAVLVVWAAGKRPAMPRPPPAQEPPGLVRGQRGSPGAALTCHRDLGLGVCCGVLSSASRLHLCFSPADAAYGCGAVLLASMLGARLREAGWRVAVMSLLRPCGIVGAEEQMSLWVPKHFCHAQLVFISFHLVLPLEGDTCMLYDGWLYARVAFIWISVLQASPSEQAQSADFQALSLVRWIYCTSVEGVVPAPRSAAQCACHRSGSEKPSQWNTSYCICWINASLLNKFQTSGRLAMRASNVFPQ